MHCWHRAVKSLHPQCRCRCGCGHSIILLQGRWKQSADGQAQLDVGGKGINNSRAKHAAKFWTQLFLAVRRRTHCTSASNWESPLLCSLSLGHTECKSYACTLTYVSLLWQILLQQLSLGTRLHKFSQMHNSGARPVPASMHKHGTKEFLQGHILKKSLKHRIFTGNNDLLTSLLKEI